MLLEYWNVEWFSLWKVLAVLFRDKLKFKYHVLMCESRKLVFVHDFSIIMNIIIILILA